MTKEQIENRCRNCGGTKQEHRGRKCPTKLQSTTWHPWTEAEYHADAAAALEEAQRLKQDGPPRAYYVSMESVAFSADAHGRERAIRFQRALDKLQAELLSGDERSIITSGVIR